MFTVAWHRPNPSLTKSQASQAYHSNRVYEKRIPFKNNHGFTLIELLITITIIALLMLITTDFIPILEQSKTRQVSNSLRAHLALTRSQSISRGGNVQLCGSDNGATCTNSLNNGWLIYHDNDKNGTLSPTDSILSRYQQDNTRLSITAVNSWGNVISTLGFNHRGYPTDPLTIELKNGEAIKSIQLYASGRISAQ